MRALILMVLVGCKSDPAVKKTEPLPDPKPKVVAPDWDEEAQTIRCAADSPGSLLDQAVADAGLANRDAVGWDATQWQGASYGAVLDDPFRLSWFRDVHWAPLQVPCFGGQRQADLDHAMATDHPIATALGEAMALLDVPRQAKPLRSNATTDIDLSELPSDLAEALVPILAAMEDVAATRAAAADIAPATTRDLVETGHGGVIVDFSSAPDLSDPDAQAWLLDPAGPQSLYDPARVLAFAIEDANLGRFEGREVSATLQSPLGPLIIAGPGNDDPGPTVEAALYLDLGGNDTYTHAAGASDFDHPVAVHIDLSGDDTYTYVEFDAGSADLLPADNAGRYRSTGYGPFSQSRTGRQGSGRFGVGMLVDLGRGDDHYQSLRMSQGWGHLGVGVLYDGGGDDTYLGEEGVQGAAAMGIGLLLDQGGNDEHRTYHNSQGFGYVAGVGIAWDGGGRDTWYANPGKTADGGFTIYPSPQLPSGGNSGFVQGAGFGMRWDSAQTYLSGGIGILRDVSGNDTYTASTFAQGSGYWQGTGLLMDGDGNDTYDAYYYVQGGAAHYAIGALLDDGPGDDRVNTRMDPNYMHFGAGHDFSVGVFVNEGGDDTYVYAGLAAGASNCQGVGLFVDNDGSDTYEARSDYSTGLGNHSTECEASARTVANSIGLFIDSGGDPDSYTWPDVGGPADDSVFGHSWNATADEHGGGIDGDGKTAVHASGEAP